MSPYQHREDVVADDGAATDPDPGPHERLIHANLTQARETGVARNARFALFCAVDRRAVISVPGADSIYEVPLMLEDSGLGNVIVEALDAPASTPELSAWKELVHRIQHPAGSVRIGVVGKYLPAPDAYISVTEALRHAGVHHNLRVDIKWIASETLETGDLHALDELE